MEKKFHIHLVSDSTGETLNALANAALAQFENVDVQIHFYALVRSEHQLARALDHITIAPGLVFFTLAHQELRDRLIARCDYALLVEENGSKWLRGQLAGFPTKEEADIFAAKIDKVLQTGVHAINTGVVSQNGFTLKKAQHHNWK